MMNDAVLSDRLRALRQPLPPSDFERRLEQALWREAQALRAERSPARAAVAARARRWGTRTGLVTALVLGATAAAAAGGSVWVWVASHERAPAPSNTPAMRAADVSGRAPVHVGTEPTPPAAALPEGVPSDSDPSTFERGASLPVDSKPDPLAAPGQGQTAQKGGLATKSRAADAPRPIPAEAKGPARVVPFELPTRELSGVVPGAAKRGSAEAHAPLERPSAAASADRRNLPDLPSRTDRRRARPERPDLDRKAEPPGRAVARERSGRDNAERGLERAKEAHERK